MALEPWAMSSTDVAAARGLDRARSSVHIDARLAMAEAEEVAGDRPADDAPAPAPAPAMDQEKIRSFVEDLIKVADMSTLTVKGIRGVISRGAWRDCLAEWHAEWL